MYRQLLLEFPDVTSLLMRFGLKGDDNINAKKYDWVTIQRFPAEKSKNRFFFRKLKKKNFVC